jgi:hypothetical protein
MEAGKEGLLGLLHVTVSRKLVYFMYTPAAYVFLLFFCCIFSDRIVAPLLNSTLPTALSNIGETMSCLNRC